MKPLGIIVNYFLIPKGCIVWRQVFSLSRSCKSRTGWQTSRNARPVGTEQAGVGTAVMQRWLLVQSKLLFFV